MTTQRSISIGFIAVTVIMMLLGCSSSEGANTTPREKLDTSITTSPPSEITEIVETVDTVEGKKVLYIGHSFGRPFARELPSFVEMAGIDNKNYSGHSLRSGFATVSADSGADERSIMAMTGHKTTQMVRRYIKEANLFKNNALNKVKL